MTDIVEKCSHFWVAKLDPFTREWLRKMAEELSAQEVKVVWVKNLGKPDQEEIESPFKLPPQKTA